MKYISILISIIALFISLLSSNCKVTYSSNEIIISIIAVCATFIVGAHLIDSWTVNSMNEKLNKLAGLEDDLRRTKEHANVALHITTAIGFKHWKPKQAVKECWKAFEMSIALNDAVRANTCLDCLEQLTHSIFEDKNNFKDEKEDLLNIILPSAQTLSSPLYKVFRKRVEEIKKKS